MDRSSTASVKQLRRVAINQYRLFTGGVGQSRKIMFQGMRPAAA